MAAQKSAKLHISIGLRLSPEEAHKLQLIQDHILEQYGESYGKSQTIRTLINSFARRLPEREDLEGEGNDARTNDI